MYISPRRSIRWPTPASSASAACSAGASTSIARSARAVRSTRASVQPEAR